MLLCYAHVDGQKITFELSGNHNLYLREGYNVVHVSWRCDPISQRCPIWAGNYCARRGIPFN